MSTLARDLAEARLGGALVDRNSVHAPDDAATAYAVQHEAALLLGPASDAWKVGSTSAEAQAALGTDQPGAARVPRRFRFVSGDAIPVFDAHDLWIEAEFALRLARDLPPRPVPWTRDEVVDAIDAVAPSLEVVGSRMTGGLARAGRYLVTADGGANVALATGAPVEDWRRFDLPAHPVRLLRNGTPVAEGTGARALGDPVAVLVWLARHGAGPKAGETVSTGTCTGLVRVRAGDVLRGEFGPIGSVEISLTDARAS